MHAKNCFFQNSKSVSQNAKFNAGFESVEKNAKSSAKNVIGGKLFHTVMKVCHFFVDIFCMNFCIFLMDSKSATNSEFLYPYCFLHFFFIILAFFANFEFKRGRYGSKKRKNFSFVVLFQKIKFCNHQRLGKTKLLFRSLYPNAHVFFTSHLLKFLTSLRASLVSVVL
jgi:hypothetical protein